MVGHTEAGDLPTDVVARGRDGQTFLPVLEVLVRALGGEGGVIDDDRDVRELVRQVTEVLHVLPLDRHAGNQVVLLQQREAAVVVRFDQVVAVGEVADAAHVGVRAVSFEDGLHAGVAQVGVRHYSVGEAGTVRGSLQPPCLRDRVGVAQGGLHVHRLGHIGVTGLGDEVLRDIVELGEFPNLPTHHRMRFSGIPMLVCVDEFQLGHLNASRVER